MFMNKFPNKYFLTNVLKRFIETSINKFNIQITESCAKKIKEVISKNPEKKYLRLLVEGGGCSGFQYVFKMDNDKTSDDEIIEKNGSILIIDRISLPYLDQATIDYKESLIKSAFQVVENKNAEMNCSCGTSFSPKMDKK